MELKDESAIAKPWLWTAEKAREMAFKSHSPGSARFKPEPAIVANGNQSQAPLDPLAEKLSRVQEQLVQDMVGNKDAKAVSALAQALKNVRETYHLVTGQAKPGVLKSGRSTPRSRDIAPQIVALPTTTNSVPAEKPVDPSHKSAEVIPP